MREFTDTDNIGEILVDNKNKKVLSLLYFTATWCGPCQSIYPLLNELSSKLSENKQYNIEFFKIDIDKNDEFCEKCNIRSVPTFYIMNGNTLLSQCTGANINTIGEMIVNTFNKFNEKILNKIKSK
jgi:thioredoxin 1